MLDIEVLDDPAAAVVALDPTRARLLAELREPASAAALATRVGLTRQKVRYHLHALETQGLVEEVATRAWGGITERVLQASARAYAVSPAALGQAAPSPGGTPAAADEGLSAAYLIALASRAVQEVGLLSRRGAKAGAAPPVVAIDAEIRFASPDDRARFADDLASAITAIVSRYHDETAPDGRIHRLVVGAHPIPPPEEAST